MQVIVVSFIPYNSNNISILFYDGINNTLRTYQPYNFDTYEENNYTSLLGSINYGYSYALESGGFIFCYNSSLMIDSIICETMKFVDSKLTNDIPRKNILSCPSPRDKFFTMYYLGYNRVILGCGYNPMYIQIVNYNLTKIGDYIMIGNSDYIRFEFTVMNYNRIYVVGSLENNSDGKFFKGGAFQIAIDNNYFNTIDNDENYFSFFLDEENNQYSACQSPCLACVIKNEQKHCLKCNNSLNYYQWRQDIYTCIEREANPERYQFDNTLKAFVYCEKGWSRDSSNEVTCYEICPELLYLDPNSNNECVEECYDANNY